MSTDYTNNILLRNTIELLSGHEFRTPINGIMGFSEFLHGEQYELREEEKKEFAKNINLSAKRLVHLSERLNIWYSLFSGNKTLKKTKFALSAKDFEELVLDEANHYSVSDVLIRFSTNMDSCNVRGSKKMFETAIRELVQNAFKFSEKNEVVSFSLLQVKNEVVIQIRNTSVSATVEELKTYTVFTRFNRKKSETQGLGLGMEIARLGITQCGGHIHIHRETSQNDQKQVVFDVYMRQEFLEPED